MLKMPARVVTFGPESDQPQVQAQGRRYHGLRQVAEPVFEILASVMTFGPESSMVVGNLEVTIGVFHLGKLLEMRVRPTEMTTV